VFEDESCEQFRSTDGTLALPVHVADLGRCSRQAIARAESRLSGAIVVFWQSAMATLDHDDAQAVRRLLPVTRVPVLHVCLTSCGGDAQAVVVLGDALRAACDRLIVHVPEQACSAATILAMYGDEIRMASGARLSAVDGTVTYDEQLSINEVEFPRLRQRAPVGQRHRHGTADGYEHLFAQISPTRIARALRSQALSERLCQRALRHIRSAKTRRGIIKAFLHDCPTHGYPINQHEAQAAGLNATLMSAEEHRLMLGLHDLHLGYGRMHRVINQTLRWRETTMRSSVGTAQRTAALVLDGELGREKIGDPWNEIWRNHGWRELTNDGICPRMAVELQGRA
jgi:hypothetical protein